ncbi:MAG: PAS domain S-box protein [Solirubrobacterales bacterium]
MSLAGGLPAFEPFEAERELEALFEDAPLGVGLVALDGHWLRVNRALCRITGYSEHELLMRTFHEMTHRADRAADRRIDEALLSGEIDRWEREKRYLRKDGEPVWVMLSGSVVRAGDGSPQYFIAHVQDITARKRLESELEAAAQSFRLSRDLMCACTMDGRLQTVNGAWGEVLGWSEEELRSHSFLHFVHPDDRERTLRETRTFLRGGESHLFRNRWMTADGGWRWLSWSAAGVPEVGRVFCTARDVTDRVEMEEMLELRGQVIASMAEGVSLTRISDLRIVYANPSLERMLGYGPGELDGREAVELLWPEDLSLEEEEARVRAVEELQRAGTSSYEGRRRRKDGAEIWCRTTTTTLEHPEFGPVWVSVQQDATEEHRAERAAAELERAKSEFLSSVSHELRTPLTSILGYTALLREDLASPGPEDAGYVEVIERNARRQLRFVEDLLGIARSQACDFEIERSRIDLRTVVEEAVEDQRPAIEKRHHELLLELSWPVEVEADAARLTQVVSNLLSNAAKFTPARGRIDVSLRRRDGEAELSVADTGAGIPATDRSKVFERLYRGPESRRDRIAGLGLGLTIARSIVEAHEGRIEIDDAPGGGALFRVLLPVA